MKTMPTVFEQMVEQVYQSFSPQLCAQMKPQKGDRILVFKEPWLSLILDQRKHMEIRCLPLAAGTYFLGMRSRIFGMIKTGAPRHIPIQSWTRSGSRCKAHREQKKL